MVLNSETVLRFIQTPIGALELHIKAGLLVKINFLEPAKSQAVADIHVLSENRIIQQIRDYFSGKLTQFERCFAPAGTAFQQQVWNQLLAIPHGETITYGALAQKLKTSPRAVGNACRANPIPIVIPCHRVIGAKGELVGYAGDTEGKLFSVKAWLLSHESQKH